MIGNNKVNPSVIDAWKEEKILSEYEINRNYLVHSLYVLYCLIRQKIYARGKNRRHILPEIPTFLAWKEI